MVPFSITTLKNKTLRLFVNGIFIFFALVGIIFSFVFVGMKFNLFSVKGTIDERNTGYFGTSSLSYDSSCPRDKKVCDWDETKEWELMKTAFQKEKPVISRVASETGVPARIIVAVVVAEQMRFFTSNREVVKKYLEPLKILGTMSQFSYGVSGIKPDTARLIEEYAASTTSPFYPEGLSPTLLATRAGEPTNNSERTLVRLTNTKDHYYSFLYTALFLHEISAQWSELGHPLSYTDDVSILATLFNLGFPKSHPKDNPSSGGAIIEVGGKKYSYGELARLFYESEELTKEFGK